MLPSESVALALALPDARLVQRVLLMLVDDEPPIDPAILSSLVRHPAIEVRMTAVAVLSRWDDGVSRRVLSEFLADQSMPVRERVLTALEDAGGVLTPATATAALQLEDNAGIARRVAQLLVRGDPAAAPRILQRAVAAAVTARRPAAVLAELLDVLRSLDLGVWQRLIRHLQGHAKAEYAALAGLQERTPPPAGDVS